MVRMGRLSYQATGFVVLLLVAFTVFLQGVAVLSRWTVSRRVSGPGNVHHRLSVASLVAGRGVCVCRDEIRQVLRKSRKTGGVEWDLPGGLRTVEFLCHEFAIPTEKRLGFHHIRDLVCGELLILRESPHSRFSRMNRSPQAPRRSPMDGWDILGLERLGYQHTIRNIERNGGPAHNSFLQQG